MKVWKKVKYNVGKSKEPYISDFYQQLTPFQKDSIVDTDLGSTDTSNMVTETEKYGTTGKGTDYSNIVEELLTSDNGYLAFNAGILPEVVVKPRKTFYAELDTYYPVVSLFPMTGHSELYPPSGNTITKTGLDDDYNLISNNCSDATRRALEEITGMKIDPFGFTTPGDVRDFAIDKLGAKELPYGYIYDAESGNIIKSEYRNDGVSRLMIPMNMKQLKKLRKYSYKRNH